MSMSSEAACRRLRDARMVSGTKHFPMEKYFYNELPLHAIGPCFIVISGAIKPAWA